MYLTKCITAYKPRGREVQKDQLKYGTKVLQPHGLKPNRMMMMMIHHAKTCFK
jgi:hypothetical protein